MVVRVPTRRALETEGGGGDQDVNASKHGDRNTNIIFA